MEGQALPYESETFILPEEELETFPCGICSKVFYKSEHLLLAVHPLFCSPIEAASHVNVQTRAEFERYMLMFDIRAFEKPA
jgi:hypothetical protein